MRQVKFLQTGETAHTGRKLFQVVVGQVLERSNRTSAINTPRSTSHAESHGCIYQLNQALKVSQFLWQAPQQIGLDGQAGEVV